MRPSTSSKRSAAAAGVGKRKSCTGCLYDSSLSMLHGQNPRCNGVTRTIPQVPLHRVGAEMDANEVCRSLSSGFKYACVGYSMFLENKDNPNDKEENRPELPSCVGIEEHHFSLLRREIEKLRADWRSYASS